MTMTLRVSPALDLQVLVRRKTERGMLSDTLSMGIAILIAMSVCGVILHLSGADLQEALSSLVLGAVGSVNNLVDTLARSTPLILTGLATVVAYRAKFWNIGQEGQLICGAMGAYLGSQVLMPGAGPVAALFITITFGALAGAFYGALAGLLRSLRQVNEIISTVMFNYIIYYLLIFLLSGPWQKAGGFYQQTDVVSKTAEWPTLASGSNLHVGFIIALVMAAGLQVLLNRTSLGYEIRAIGHNPTASRFKGINVGRTLVLVSMLSGALAGLAGAGELFGVHHRLQGDISAGYGFMGIVVAMLGGLRPFPVVIAGLLFGGLINGSFLMQVMTGVPTAIVYVVQAIVLIVVVSTRAAAGHSLSLRIHRRHPILESTS